MSNKFPQYVLLILLSALIQWAAGQEGITPPGEFSVDSPASGRPNTLAGENISISVRWVANEYLSPETEKIDRNYITLESFDEVAGEDVRVELWGIPENDLNVQVWVFVHDRTADKWWAYGSDSPEGNGIWVTRGVRFGEGANQGQRFTLRAAILAEAPPEKLISAEDWQSRALAISDPVYITVKRRLIRPYQPSGNVEEPQLWLSTVDHLTVSATEPMVVPPTAGIAGTFALPAPDAMNPNGKTRSGKPYIYVLIRSTAADRWRVFGPAVLNGVKWEVRDVDIADPGEPQWVRFKVSAVMTYRRLQEGYIDYEDWWEHKITASDPVEVSVKPYLPTISRSSPGIQIQFLQTLRDTLGTYANEPLEVDSIGEVIQVGGDIEDLPQGASVWLLINPIGTSFWEVHGRAIITPPSWRLPVVHTSRFKVLNISKFRLFAIVSTSTIKPGLIDYDDWRMNTLSISEALVVTERKKSDSETSRITLRISEVGGNEADDSQTLADIHVNAQVKGEVNRLPAGSFIWVGTRKNHSEIWHFTGPAFLNDRQWNMPQAYFSGINESDASAAFSQNSATAKEDNATYDVVAMATKGDLPNKTLKADELHWYALATSPVVRVNQVTEMLSFFNPGGYYTLFIIIVVLLLLSVLEYYFRAVSEVSEKLADAFDQLNEYLAHQFDEMPKPKVIPSAFGVLILCLGIFAIVGYFPIYTHVLERVLKLSPEKSESLALLLIIFIGLAGVIMHLSIEFISEREGLFINRVFNYFLNYALPITVLLVTLSLWGVQALLYLELYMNQVETGNIRIPAAMGAAAFFIAGIETLGFYWAARLGKEFFGWLLFHLFIIGPPAFLAKFFRIISTFFHGLHERSREPEKADKKVKLGDTPPSEALESN